MPVLALQGTAAREVPMRVRLLVAMTLLLLLPGACAFQGEEEDPDGDLGSAAASGGVDLLPTSDIAKTAVVGEGDTAALFRDVDDGVGSSAADDRKTLVRSDGVAT